MNAHMVPSVLLKGSSMIKAGDSFTRSDGERLTFHKTAQETRGELPPYLVQRPLFALLTPLGRVLSRRG